MALRIVAGEEPRVPAQFERCTRLLGQEVQDGAAQRLGKLGDLVLDVETGRVLYAVISLQASDRQVAVPAGSIAQRGNHLITHLDRKHLARAPQFSNTAAQRREMLSMPFISKVYTHGGEHPWWESESRNPASRFGNVQTSRALKGMDVRNTANQKVGDVEDLIIDLRNGRVPFVILAPDRSLDLKGNLYAIPPKALTSVQSKSALITHLDRAGLGAAPHFDKSRWPDFSKTGWASQQM